MAADGANSRVRQALGVKMVGQAELQHLVNIHFWAPGIARRLRIERPAMLYFVFSPNAVVVIVAHDLNEGEFVAQVRCCRAPTLLLATNLRCLGAHAYQLGSETFNVSLLSSPSLSLPFLALLMNCRDKQSCRALANACSFLL